MRLPRTRIGCALLIGVLVTGCGTETAAPSADPVATIGDFAGLVDIGGGREMFLDCSGTGAPTVVLIAGNLSAGDGWKYSGGSTTDDDDPPTANDAAVYPTTARFTRVCAYDRPGTQLMDGGPTRSTSVEQPTTVQGDAADLHALLTAAGIGGPLVLVGHSLGGFIATVYARTFPDEVVGLVMVDGASEYLETTLGPTAFAQWAKAFSTIQSDPTGEAPDLIAGTRASKALPPMRAMPASVLTADPWPFAFPDADGQPKVDHWAQWFAAQELLAKSLNATHVTHTNTGHSIYIENAALVNEQICAVVEPAGGC